MALPTDALHDFLMPEGSMDGWMNGVLGHFYALLSTFMSRLNWAGDNLG